jgi:hypothetical protein
MKFFKDFITNLTFSGLEYFGLYYSKYRAFVYDNNDPDGCGRLRLIIPLVDELTPLKTWALPTGMFGGEDYGSHILPQKGDLVWVEFEMGKLKNPIWSFSYFGKGEKPSEFDSPNVYGFKSPKGHVVKIDDNKNTIQIIQKDGISVLIDNNKFSLIQKDGIILNIEDNKYYIGKEVDKMQPLVLGDELQKQLDIEKARVSGIIEAITTAAVTAGDGGAVFKTNMITIIKLLEKPDYSKIKSTLGKIE